MEVLSQKYPGLYFICTGCGALIAHVQKNEIYEKQYVYCPICKTKNNLEIYEVENNANS